MRHRLALLLCGVALGAPLPRAMAQRASCPPACTAADRVRR
ncbi:MAG: hypothetical protein ACKN99_06845 [Gemmatimonadota bacterium]